MTTNIRTIAAIPVTLGSICYPPLGFCCAPSLPGGRLRRASVHSTAYVRSLLGRRTAVIHQLLLGTAEDALHSSPYDCAGRVHRAPSCIRHRPSGTRASALGLGDRLLLVAFGDWRFSGRVPWHRGRRCWLCLGFVCNRSRSARARLHVANESITCRRRIRPSANLYLRHLDARSLMCPASFCISPARSASVWCERR